MVSTWRRKFNFPYTEDKYSIAGKFLYDSYPANPNGSDFNTAMLVSDDGRHLVMMPHLERSIYLITGLIILKIEMINFLHG